MRGVLDNLFHHSACGFIRILPVVNVHNPSLPLVEYAVQEPS
jgi:hypothetical protein